MKRWHTWLVSFTYVVFFALVTATPAFAHDQPDGADWLMADWMLLSFMVFFGVALIAFVVALKRGYLSNLEDAKYHILTIDEPDYYTPEWAKEEDDDSEREHD